MIFFKPAYRLDTAANLRAWLFFIVAEMIGGGIATLALETPSYYPVLIFQTYVTFGVWMAFASKTALHNDLAELLVLEILVQWFGLFANELGVNGMYFVIGNGAVLILKFWRISMRAAWPPFGLMHRLTGRKNCDRQRPVDPHYFLAGCLAVVPLACILYATWGDLKDVLALVAASLLLKEFDDEIAERDAEQFLDLSALSVRERDIVKRMIKELSKNKNTD